MKGGDNMELRNLFAESGDAIARIIVNYHNAGDNVAFHRLFSMLNTDDQDAVITAYESNRLKDWRYLRSLMA